MNTVRVLHQQVMQLRYYFLACLGLIMVVPIEETLGGLAEGHGDYRLHISIPFLMMGPLLTALIACATVQADLDEKRCLFWQSKPVRTHVFLAFKYVIGLVLSLAIIACPIGLVAACSYLVTHHSPMPGFLLYSLNVALISVLTYSTSFLCNVLVRRTARAWLLGMALAGFVLMIPFMLPLPAEDVVTDVLKWMAGVFLTVTLSATVLAFGLALMAMHYRWHLRANLRGLLWGGAGLVFAIAVLLGRQVANIEILDEVRAGYSRRNLLVKEPGRYGWGTGELTIEGDRLAVSDLDHDMTEQERTRREALDQRLQAMSPHYEVEEGLSLRSHPSSRFGRMTWELEEGEHFVAFYVYSREEEVERDNGEYYTRHRDERVYLRLFQKAGPVELPISTIDLSDCIGGQRHAWPAMRRIEDQLVVLVGDQCLVIEIKTNRDLEIVERNRYQGMTPYFYSRRKLDPASPTRDDVFAIPLIPGDGVDIRQRVKLSVDLAAGIYGGRLHQETLVSDSNDKMRFASAIENGMARYDVLGWDREEIQCRFRDARRFLFGGDSWGNDSFVHAGRYYVHNWNTLMVFDIRADHGIRKLGHFQRFSDTFEIGDIGVEENGNIVLFSNPLRKYDEETLEPVHTSTIYLLKAP